MKLTAEWKKIMRHAWSVRLFGLSIVLQAADVILSTSGAFSGAPDSRMALQLAGVLCAAGGVVARVIAQRELDNGQ